MTLDETTCLMKNKEIITGNINQVLNAAAEISSNALVARGNFVESMNKMLESTPIKTKSEVPMIKLKHRWLKNRNVSYSGMIISFDNDGVAEIPNLGNNILAMEGYVRSARGLVEIISRGDGSEPEAVSEAPVVAQAPAVEPEVVKETIEPSVMEGEEEVNDEQAEDVTEPPVLFEEDLSLEGNKDSSEERKESYVERKPFKKPVGKKFR